MQVAGITTPQEVFVASRDRKFRINELLVIDDPHQGPLIGEVVEANSYNRFIPLSIEHAFSDAHVLESLKSLGYSIDEDEINIAKVKLMSEASYPVTTGSYVHLPGFAEVKGFLIKGSREEGLLLGEIKNTEETARSMDEDLKGLFYIYSAGKLDKTKNVPFILDLRSFQQYPHIGIFGGSGSGKSFGMRVILEELAKHNIPTVILDPHYEMDFSESQEDIPKAGNFKKAFSKFQIGEHIGVEFLNLSKRDLLALLSAVSPLSEAMSSAVEVLHRRGDTYLSFSSRLDDLAQALEMGRSKIDNALRQDMEPSERERFRRMRELLEDYQNIPLPSVQGIAWRLRRLYSSGLFSHDIKPVKEAMMQGKLAVIQGPIWLLQVFSTYMLSNIYRQRRDYKDSELKGQIQGDYFPPFVIATDEAHNFAPKGRETATKGIITEIAQEGRKYGVFLVLATQRPTLLDETVTAQLNTKIIFRTVRGSDIATITEETDIKAEEARRLPYLPSGDAFVSSPLFGRTVAIRVRFPYTRSPHTQNPIDEIKNHRASSEEKLLSLISQHLPIYAANFARAVEDINRDSEEKYEVRTLKETLDALVEKGRLKKQPSPLGDIYM
ncbi:ATP-binding protein [Biomaibacter acetigenes]|uniref:ATP-binding protein n=1 Tax=Biomaibacter acetigenes TaxID=2316383 RepID=A0A3G2R1N2_9FIRM|nr:ATP-binding protein [Biomaibacter acetigenes]AYO29249.1 ATP-binding protein [Biomaibacter acetigenes]